MSVTLLICIGISDLSVSRGGHRCHRCHHFLEGYSTYLRDTCTPWLVRLWCESKGVPQICGDSGDGGDCPHVTSPDKLLLVRTSDIKETYCLPVDEETDLSIGLCQGGSTTRTL